VRPLVTFLLPFGLLLTFAANSWAADERIPSVAGDVSGSSTAIAVDGVSATVEVMIGEATFVAESVEGKKATIIVPTGKATRKDPETGQILLTLASTPDPVNEVVRTISGSAPDASNRLPTDEGCSKGRDPLRLVARPEYDEAGAAAIASQLEELSPGELVMVLAVMINNANHLCIDAATIANTVALIAKVRPDEAGNMVFVASLLDPDNAALYTNAAGQPPKASPVTRPPAKPNPPIKPERDIPPGGSIGAPPSPE
jgi:hypothetical protein